MPNRSLRDVRQRRQQTAPGPRMISGDPLTDTDGNRLGDRPKVGPAPPDVVHQRLQALDAEAKQPRPQPAVERGPLGVKPAARQDIQGVDALINRRADINKSIDDAS